MVSKHTCSAATLHLLSVHASLSVHACFTVSVHSLGNGVPGLGNGVLGLAELMLGLSAFAHGLHTDRMRLAFNAFDKVFHSFP